MDRQPSHGGRLVHAGQLLALTVVYVVLGTLGLAQAPEGGLATLIWAPTGVSLAALVLGGYRLWPGVAVGAFATNVLMGAPPLVACGIAAGNTLEAVLGAWALRSIPGFRGSVDRFREVVVLAVPVGMGTTAISATVGVTSLTLAGIVSTASFARTWLVWWTGDLIGALVVAPVLLTWARGPRVVLRPAALAGAAAYGAFLVGCASLVFAQRREAVARIPLLQPYVLFLPLIWAAVRYGPCGAATATFVTTVAAVLGTSAGRGAFARADRTESLIALHVFIASASLASLALGAIVSERERSQRGLRESEQLLRTIVDGATDAIYIKDRLGRYLLVNVEASHVLGRPASAVIGKDDSALLPAKEASSLREVDEEVMRTGQPREAEESLTSAGTTHFYHTTKVPYRDHAGAVIGVIGISRDITGRKRVERVRENEERQRLAFEAAHLGMWFWDVRSDRLACTPLCRSMHGIGPDEEVSYARFIAMLHPDDRERTERAVARALAEHAECRIEYRVVPPDGSVRWLSMHGRALCGEAGALDRMLGVTFDITAQKRAEQERTELLLREQAARAEAQAATRAKDEFLAVLSHELRTPLQSMLGWTHMLNERPSDGRMVRKGLQVMERNIKTQAQLIEDLLDVSRIVTGKLRLEHRPVDLTRVIGSALETAKVAADAKSIRVDATIKPLAGEVLGDPERLQQIVSNLLSNAVKFTPNRGRVGVRLEREGTRARITVEDAGSGIAPEFLPHVFDRFRQAESTTVRSHGGLGLGLAIVRHLVEVHGGTVSAESPGEGRGATFTVTLPLVNAGPRAAPEDRERTESPSNGSSAPVALDGVRVLVVDDDPDARELIMTVLRESGAEVHAVPSVRAALDELDAFSPHVLMSDIGMPEEDGYALIRQVRARESADGHHVPAVALTAFASQADREQALAFGFDAHLAKPASPVDLTRMVAGMLGRAA